jgi:hypothetical protein
VFCIVDCATGLADGLTLHLRRGQVWAADDAAVTEHWADGLFADEPAELCRSTPDPSRVVDLEDGLLHAPR